MRKFWFFVITFLIASCGKANVLDDLSFVERPSKSLRIKSMTEIPFIHYSNIDKDLYLLDGDKYFMHSSRSAIVRDPVSLKETARGEEVNKGSLGTGIFSTVIQSTIEYVNRQPHTALNYDVFNKLSGLKNNCFDCTSQKITYKYLDQYNSFRSSEFNIPEFQTLMQFGEVAYAPTQVKFKEKDDLIDYIVFENMGITKLYIFADETFIKTSDVESSNDKSTVTTGHVVNSEFSRIKLILQNYHDEKENFRITQGGGCKWNYSKRISFFHRGEFIRLEGRKNCDDPNYDEISELFDLSILEELKIN